ncbi:MAG: type I-E CRISPR-associated protein Cse1/CasA [Syntrophales bacterium]|jgi:CRISPR system Cascade subunit CasA
MNDMKRFNLLFDSWIPARTRNGETKPIKAFEIVQEDIIAIDAPRADFNAALMQFLIGLLQTVYAPENPKVWRNLFNQPPSEAQLRENFEQIKGAFYLDGDGYRFMQDTSIKESGNKASILKLIPGIVGENTIDKNQDFFVKSSQISCMSVNNLISALYLYQNYCLSETGGRFGRHHGSFRGRNTITAFVVKEDGNLWENLWLNVIQKNTFNGLIQSGLTNSDFEWMNDRPNGKQKTDNDLIRNDIYWSMPRRVWVDFSELKNGICDLTSKKTEVIQNVYIKENGIQYATKLTQHPLIPYFKDTEGLHPTKIGAEGVNYGDWLSLVGSETASQNLLEHANRRNLNGDFKILACGYWNHPQQAKTLCWYQTNMPLYALHADKANRERLEAEINRYVQASRIVANSSSGYLSAAMRMAWFGHDYYKEKQKKMDKEPAGEIARSFWNNTERMFYELMEALHNRINGDTLSAEKYTQLRRAWYDHIKKEAESLFNRWAFRSGIQNNPKRIARAYNQLMGKLTGTVLKQDILALPKEEKQ